MTLQWSLIRFLVITSSSGIYKQDPSDDPVNKHREITSILRAGRLHTDADMLAIKNSGYKTGARSTLTTY